MGSSTGEIHGRDPDRTGSGLDLLSAGRWRDKTDLVGVRPDPGNGTFTWYDRNYLPYELPEIFCKKNAACTGRSACVRMCDDLSEGSSSF